MVQSSKPSPRLFLSAGEASGDHYGAAILAEMRARISSLTAFGLGGNEMKKNGFEQTVRAEEVAVMGITEVIRHMPSIYARYRRLKASIKTRKPDVAILIDFPDVNLRLAKFLKRLEIPVVYFVSPQLWAWKRSRLRWVQQRVTKMLVIFPFEEPFYRNRNVDAQFVGHPLATLEMPSISRAEFASRYKLSATKQWISILPGSRRKEILLNLPEMLKAAQILLQNHSCEFLLPVASTVGNDFFRTLLKDTNLPLTLVDDARSALLHSRAGIVASGTATVQAAVIGNPFVIVYRVSDLTYSLAKRLVRYPEEIRASPDTEGNLPIGMVNLIAGRRIVPELVQACFTAENVVNALVPLLSDGPGRDTMIAELAEVRRRLLPVDGTHSIEKVCDTIESLLRPSSKTSAANSPINV